MNITTELSDGTLRPGTVRVRTYEDVLSEYVRHRESKSLGPDGETVGAPTAGLLRRRPVEAIPPTSYVGKEGNKLDDRMSGLVTDPANYPNYRSQYVDPEHTIWTELVIPVLATMDRGEVARLSGLHRRTIERYLRREAIPHGGHDAALVKLATEQASASFVEWGFPVAKDLPAILHNYLASVDDRGSTCQRCGEELSGRQTQWCSNACRMRSR